MIIKNMADQKGIEEIGRIIGSIRDALVEKTAPGITTKELDDYAGELFKQEGAASAPMGVYNFPGYTCISVNEEVAHGIPGPYAIKEGDLVNIDVSGSKDGYFADTGVSFMVGTGNKEAHKVCEVVKKAFEAGLEKIKPNGRTSDIGEAVFNTAKAHDLTVIMNLTGHGVGGDIHESPDHIFNYKNTWDDVLLKEGMVLAFEPFISTDEEEVYQKNDGWTLAVEDSKVAQIEHTIIVSKNGPIIVT